MKKIFIGVIWTVLLAAVISVCGQSDSGLQVLKYEWKPNYRNASSTIPTMTDPQRTPSPPDFIKNANGTISLNPESRRVNPVGSPEPAVVFPRPLQRSIKAILELKNNSPKRIISIEADYVFYDRDKKEYYT